MNRRSFLCLHALLLLAAAHAVPPSIRASEPSITNKPEDLEVSPAPPPTQVFKYRLLPPSSELNPGDAAPVYLRIRHQLGDGAWKSIDPKVTEWLKLPHTSFPTDEASKFLDSWLGRLALLEIGSRRESCDWSFTLPEQRLDAIEILLPDTQDMRTWARLIALKARVEVARGKFDYAARTIETGIAFGRHVGGGPFVMNGLVGIAICNSMLGLVEELIDQPDAPNLYWALTALPRPLMGIRRAMETDQMLDFMIPEFAEVDTPHSQAGWTVLVEKIHDRLTSLARRLDAQDGAESRLKPVLTLDLRKFKQEVLATSTEVLKREQNLSEGAMKAMTEDERVARAIVAEYRSLRDEVLKASYLPWAEARAASDAARKRLKGITSGPMLVLARLHPYFDTCLDAELRLDRRVAALRVIEALRAYAASHDGLLPESLSQVTEVPVPDDPATGKPFAYHRDGASALVAGPVANLTGPAPVYRVSVRAQTKPVRP